MAFAPTSPITGAAINGLTAPTFTHLQDSPPDLNGKQVYISALGGTQTGATAHSVAAPFTCAMFRPKVLKTLAPVNAVTGVLRSVPMNTYKVITRKGVLPLAGQSYKTALFKTEMDIPAGSDTADAANLKTALSAHIGLLQQIANGIADTVLTGTI